MRMPFESLMEYAAGISDAEKEKSLGELASRVGESADRLADAIMAVRECRGEVAADIRPQEES